MKNQVIHARIKPETKTEAEKILKKLGITMSQAIDLYLRQIVIKKGIPFKFDILTKEENELEKLARVISSVDGGEPPLEAKKILRLYANDDIDYDTACFMIERLFKSEWPLCL